MNYVDIIIIVFLALSFFRGYRQGLIGMLAWLAGLLIGVWLAGHYYQVVALWLHNFIKSEVWATTVAFAGIVLICSGIVGGLFSLVNRFFNLIPFVGFINKILGGIVALIEGVIIVGVIVWFIRLLPIDHPMVKQVHDSQVASISTNASAAVRWLLPIALRQAETIDLQAIGFSSLDFNPEKLLRGLTPEQERALLDYLQSTSTKNSSAN